VNLPDERLARVGDIELCYETFGDPGDPAVLLVMGLGTQMLAWHEEFCTGLAERGFYVIRYDNRDVGGSTHLDHVPPPGIAELLTRRPRRPPYRLHDMADDGAGLLDELGIERAHVVGASMGGMIAQMLAARQPDRVLSLVSIMSSTGNRWSGQPAIRLWPWFLRSPPRGKDAYLERAVRLFRVVGSAEHLRDEDALRETLALAYDRDAGRAGTLRQLAAIMASGNREADLRKIRAPTLVIHGKRDRLVAPSGGRATARAIPGARLMMLSEMGHDLARGLWPRLLDAIEENAARADAAAGRAAA
jgi:pimeloyl-ACP methyl ester carboxylesterase